MGDGMCFDASGRMIKGWFKSGDDWYYLGEDGGMLSGQWLQYEGSWYYLDKSGLMARNALVKRSKGDGYDYVGPDGIYNLEQSLIIKRNNGIDVVA